MNLTRYKKNLKVVDDKIYSYNTHVATIDYRKQEIKKLGYWSSTTSKHINYVARELNFKTII